MPGVLLCCSACQAHREHSWLGSYFVHRQVRHLKGLVGGVLLSSSAYQAFDEPASVQLPMQACGEREAMVMVPPPIHDSAVSPCFRGCLAFLLRHFPPQSPPSHPLSPSLLQSTAALALGLLHNPLTPAPSHCPFQGTSVPVWGMYGCSKNCLILIPFRFPEISCFTLSL